jgi:hypothetical protein
MLDKADPRVWFAVVNGRTGYALDAYPEEVSRYCQELRQIAETGVIGPYLTREAALTVVMAALRTRPHPPDPVP